ncbi:type II toxin-antitoxin system RelE/ParE family toxin [Bradyrhizobium sp.]|uniref:type II toxin-antitoxin system RelE/ParE family toxin n=1 Tax=Bradyrhizobium sp. TaxID=376 RepID=UPI00271A4517|nr:type II toxin-antitoxin system RelE/ParE family toxin [Bradyrhizobium sp.]MDO9296973.1 type II toxin-antitoxin system RelE/ParE family toxin [Bradyrhizobium sp.]
MQVYKLRAFARFQRREGITDRMLGKAIGNAERGLVDADLGGGLIKQRTARPGQGKSGGYRTIIAYRRGDRAVFLFGFAKSERTNLDDDELSCLRQIGRSYLSLGDDGLEMAITADEVMEVSYGQEEQG